jgi:hypothetical protein
VSHVSAGIRTFEKIKDYVGFSLPLVLLAFVAAGFAIGMLFADILARIDVTDQILQVVSPYLYQNEIKP